MHIRRHPGQVAWGSLEDPPRRGPNSRRSAAPNPRIEESRLMTMADTAMPITAPSEPPATRTAPRPAAPQLDVPAPPLAAPTVPGLGALPPIPVSATLAANETLARKRRAGEPVL